MGLFGRRPYDRFIGEFHVLLQSTDDGIIENFNINDLYILVYIGEPHQETYLRHEFRGKIKINVSKKRGIINFSLKVSTYKLDLQLPRNKVDIKRRNSIEFDYGEFGSKVLVYSG